MGGINTKTMNFDLGYGLLNQEQMDSIIRTYITQFGEIESFSEKFKWPEVYYTVKDALTNKSEDPPGRLKVVRQMRELLFKETESERTEVRTD